ncbi:unnamed protein product [Arctia plantaginis]|uniref:C2H2-type domain-containing protein n=1 Tax=Arctia plantaginis TaxID=874455 RepID=A0A8S1AXD7_ARCPL|nr:unnamed protein product [Arctia plantaginis]
MDELCTACHCTGRKLFFITETGFENIYLQIINEIPIYNLSDLCVRICWECKALLRKLQGFKEQVKRCYTELLQYVQQNTTKPFPRYPRLQTQQTHLLSYPISVKEEVEEKSALDIDMPLTDDDTLMNDDVPINGDDDFDVKSEETHCEPETFVRDLNLDVIKKRKGIKKVAKHIKEKSKKKQKIEKNEKEIKKKVKKKPLVVKEPRRVKRTIESIIDSTISDCYNKDMDPEDEEKIEEQKGEKSEEATELTDTADNVEIMIYPAAGFKPKLRKPPTKSNNVDIKKVTQSERPTCTECGKTFSSRKTYKYHLNVLHKGQNRYPCPQCGKVYQWKSNLGRHIRSHKARDSGELYCETCDKRFASVATYRQHLRISRRHVSESEFSFSCNDCGKKFVNKTRLRDHIDWEHLKKIKFKCVKCNKPFKCHTSLYVHMQNVHCAKDQKLNLCHVCGKSYQNAAKLKYHIVAMHTSETPYQCQQCSAAFGWYSSLYRHVKEVHYKIKLQTKKGKKQKKTEVLPSLLPVMPQQLMLQPIHQPGPA